MPSLDIYIYKITGFSCSREIKNSKNSNFAIKQYIIIGLLFYMVPEVSKGLIEYYHTNEIV